MIHSNDRRGRPCLPTTNWVALFRGINVGGNHILPMKELTPLLEKLGCAQVVTYIQSGNALFQHTNPDPTTLTQKIEVGIFEKYGFSPRLLLMKQSEFEKIVTQNPFSDAQLISKTLHLFFLFKKPTTPNFEELNRLKSASEAFSLIDTVFYLHAPDGIGRSALVAKIEKLLGVNVTARNWNTASALHALIKAPPAKPLLQYL